MLLVIGTILCGCASGTGIRDLKFDSYKKEIVSDNQVKWVDSEDNVFVQLQTAAISQPVNNLVVHYGSLFPSGEPIRPGDTEEYLKINNRNAYRVVFRPTFIRQRKRLTDKQISDPTLIPNGWTKTSIEDPLTGESVDAMYGPIIPRQRVLYLVEGDKFVYYIFLRADGEAIDKELKKFDSLVKTRIAYK